MEEAGEVYQDRDTRMTNLEVLARAMFDTALERSLNSGKAREFIVDRLEGKAGRAAPVQGTNTELDEQLDRAAVALLNEITTNTKE